MLLNPEEPSRVGFEGANVLAQQGIALAHNALGLGLTFRVVHHQLQRLLVDFREEGMNRALYVMKRQQETDLVVSVHV